MSRAASARGTRLEGGSYQGMTSVNAAASRKTLSFSPCQEKTASKETSVVPNIALCLFESGL